MGMFGPCWLDPPRMGFMLHLRSEPVSDVTPPSCCRAHISDDTFQLGDTALETSHLCVRTFAGLPRVVQPPSNKISKL